VFNDTRVLPARVPARKLSGGHIELFLERALEDARALVQLRDSKSLHRALGQAFINIYTSVKELEYAEFMKVISPWEREFLLLNV